MWVLCALGNCRKKRNNEQCVVHSLEWFSHFVIYQNAGGISQKYIWKSEIKSDIVVDLHVFTKVDFFLTLAIHQKQSAKQNKKYIEIELKMELYF
jgi:hypothetical protein